MLVQGAKHSKQKSEQKGRLKKKDGRPAARLIISETQMSGKGRQNPGAPIRGSVAFQTRCIAINQQVPLILDQDIEIRTAEKELVEQPCLVSRALSH